MAPPTVLVLDDNAAFVRTVETVAANAGLAVTATDDPEVFADQLCREEIIAAIVDCVVGDRNGLGILARIGEAQPALPTLVVSGYGDCMLGQAEQIARMRHLTRLSTLAKPFGLEQLRGFLESARQPA